MKNPDIVALVRSVDPALQQEKAYRVLLNELTGMIKIRHDRVVSIDELENSRAIVYEFFTEVRDINTRGRKIGTTLGFDRNFFARALMARWTKNGNDGGVVNALMEAISL